MHPVWKHAKIIGIFQSGTQFTTIRKQQGTLYHICMSHLLSPPQFENHIFCARPNKSFVYFRQVHKSRWKQRRCKLCTGLCASGRCWCCNGPLGEGREGSPHIVRVHDCIICIMSELERYRILTMLVLSCFIPAVLQSPVGFQFGHRIRVSPGDEV